MLASEPASTNGQRAANGERKPAAGGEGKGNLADRIRALQLKASRVPADELDHAGRIAPPAIRSP